MKCLYCECVLPASAVEYSHQCPNIGDGEGRVVRMQAGMPSCVDVLLDLARSISTTMPDSGSTWGAQARRALALAREEGVTP